MLPKLLNVLSTKLSAFWEIGEELNKIRDFMFWQANISYVVDYWLILTDFCVAMVLIILR
jgi:hypothetical protein